MKVLFIAHEMGLNGASKSLSNLIDEMQDEIDIYVLIKRKGLLSDNLSQKKCHVLIHKFFWDAERRDDSVLRSYIKRLRYLFLHKPLNLLTALQLSKFVRKNGIDIVHTNSSCIFMGAYLKMINKRIKHIWHFREFLYEDFGMEPVLGWNNFFDIVNKYTDAVITISDAVNDKYKNNIMVPKFRIYNGLPVIKNAFAPEKHDTLNIIQSGIISPVKGVDVSVKAMRILHDQGYDNIHLYLAGKGDLDFCKEDYEAIKPYIHVLGYVDNLNEIRQRNMDIELVCSKSEAFGRVTIEAMQTGMFVIGSNTGGTRELIHDGENGLLFKMGDPIDLADKIKLIINKKVDYTKIKQNALIVAKGYSISKCASNIRNLYIDILKGETLDEI